MGLEVHRMGGELGEPGVQVTLNADIVYAGPHTPPKKDLYRIPDAAVQHLFHLGSVRFNQGIVRSF